MVFDDVELRSDSDSVAVIGRKRILVVDDDQSQSDVLAYRLSNQGFDVVVANCGQQALGMAQTENPDLVLMDIGLPDVDGLTVCREMVDDERTCEIPVIILSGMERHDLVRNSRAAGCKYFVHKPYDPNALLVLIQDSLASGRDW